MKKILVITALFLLTFITVSHAQFVIGGNIGFSANNTKAEPTGDTHKITTINMVPRFGYIFGDNWAGIEVGINSSTHENTDLGKDKTNLTTIAPFFRHNFINANNMGVWLEAQAGVVFGKSDQDGTDYAKYTGFGAGIRPGVIFYVTESLSFEASFGRLAFRQMKNANPNDSSINSTNSEFGLNLNGDTFLFGVNYSFGGASEK
jgi:hypothetical protein